MTIRKEIILLLTSVLLIFSACESNGDIDTKFVFFPTVTTTGANVISLAWNGSINYGNSLIRYDIYGKKLGDSYYTVFTNSQETNVNVDYLDYNTPYQFYIVAVCSNDVTLRTGASAATTLEMIPNRTFDINTTGTATPDSWAAGYTNSAKEWLATYTNYSGVIHFFNSDSNNVYQDYFFPIIVNGAMNFSIRFMIVSANLAGTGWFDFSPECPVQLQLTFIKQGSPTIYFLRHYNITTNSNSGPNPDFELVNASQWYDKSYSIASMGVSDGYRLSRVLVKSTGWTRSAYVNSVDLQ